MTATSQTQEPLLKMKEKDSKSLKQQVLSSMQDRNVVPKNSLKMWLPAQNLQGPYQLMNMNGFHIMPPIEEKRPIINYHWQNLSL